MDEITEVPEFLFTFPVWVIVPAVGKFGILPRQPYEDGFAVPIFTDEDLASNFLEHARDPERFKLLPLENPLALLGFLAFLVPKKIAYVFIDPAKRRIQVSRVQILMSSISRCLNDISAAKTEDN